MAITSTSSKKYKVGLVQINTSFSNQYYLPYSVGLLQAYAEQNLENVADYEFLLPIYKREPIQDIVDRLVNADIVAFSAYVWNIRISLAVAERLKTINPDIIVLFGGPQVPDVADEFLRKYRYIDIVCNGEGERVFTNILRRLPSKDFSNLESVCYMSGDEFVFNPRISRITSLDSIPSPYLSNIFDPLMASSKEHWLMMWETNRGCPFSCTFCDWGSAIASKVSQFNIDRLYEEINWMSNKQIEFIFCCDANFGMLKRDVEIATRIAENKKKFSYPHALSVQNAKNATERTYLVQKILSDNGLNKGVTLSMQSINPQTLVDIKRANISSDTYSELQSRFTKDNIETYSDIILGLPGETYETLKYGISKLISDGQHNRIQFNNLSILPNAEMGNRQYQENHGMVIVESKTINMHGEIAPTIDGIDELQELVVGTKTTPKDKWISSRAFCWMVNFLYFNKILQIPISIVNKFGNIEYQTIFEAFFDNDISQYETINSIKQFFIDKAVDIQNGGEEYCPSPEWLNIWWPADEYIYIQLVQDNKMELVYEECFDILVSLIDPTNEPLQTMLKDSIMLNKALLKAPFTSITEDISLSYPIYELYTAIIRQDEVVAEQRNTTYTIDKTQQVYTTFIEWCKYVVWYGNKKGAYLYKTITEKDVPVVISFPTNPNALKEIDGIR